MKIGLFKRGVLKFWSSLKSSYWFIPSLMTLGSILLATGMVEIDAVWGLKWFESLGWVSSNEPEGARALLSTIAGSMITVAGVTFSMTLLSVSHASAQIGPRILSGFMNDKGNQITLGTFIATFVFCLLVLRTVRSSVEGAVDSNQTTFFVPHLSIVTAMFLALLSITVLIYFINHVPKTISMTFAINRVGSEMINQVKAQYIEKIGQPKQEDCEESDSSFIPKDFELNNKELCANGKGYIRYLDSSRLMEIASDNDLIVKLALRPGDFVCDSTLLAQVYPRNHVNDEILDAILNTFIWGVERDFKQDLMFSVNLLVEVAIRALSPGVNDPFTAHECINQLQAGVVEFIKNERLHKYRFDEPGDFRVLVKSIEFDELINSIYDGLRNYVKNDPLTTIHLLKSMGQVKNVLEDQKHLILMDEQIDALYQASTEAVNGPKDILMIKEVKAQVC